MCKNFMRLYALKIRKLFTLKQKKIAIGNVTTSKTIEPRVARISIKPDPSGSAVENNREHCFIIAGRI